jgi:hypothetical protein
MYTILGLPCLKFRSKSALLCIRYGDEYTHQRIIFIGSKSAKSHFLPFFMGWIPQNGEPIKLNGAFHLDSSILQFVVASATKAKLGALSHSCQTNIFFGVSWKI